MLETYDVIVVGAGHAGNEAAAASANLGAKTLLITMNMNTIGHMSCNPAMGGVAKGQIVREIDALGGYSGIVSDKSAIQFKMLNRSKGPAMWSPRTQNDRFIFAQEWRIQLEQTPNLDFWQDTVKSIIVENNKVCGVRTSMGIEIKSKKVILTNGTFLNGLIHLGEKNFGGGRAGDPASFGITEQLQEIGFTSGRMKTGTPPRVDGRTLDYTKMEEQPGDENPDCFSFLEQYKLKNQKSCHITYTNPLVHEILETGFEKSPMFNGRIGGKGPRYCPSIEDKITRFKERERHQIFAEPEGWDTIEVYVNGFSSSLPEEVQFKALRQIPGFENVKMFRPGYAIEYDYFPPTQLKHTLETTLISGLYFAGQINGTTGYEEAGGQGLMAGINAALALQEKEPLILSRSESYIGVLIDDLITKGTEEPYRMFTSRAEYRILLRQDNADQRLTPIGHAVGLASDERMKLLENKQSKIKGLKKYFKNLSVEPQEVNPILEGKQSSPIKQKLKIENLITRPNIFISDFIHLPSIQEYLKTNPINQKDIESAEIEIKYAGYISKEKDQAQKLNSLENKKIPKNLDYSSIPSISNEAREKLKQHQPQNLNQASKISGISPSDLNVLMIYLNQ